MPTSRPAARSSAAISGTVGSSRRERAPRRPPAGPRRCDSRPRAAPRRLAPPSSSASMITILVIVWRGARRLFDYAFFQRGLWEVLLLSGAAGLIGTWIVLRGLAFYGHAIAAGGIPRARRSLTASASRRCSARSAPRRSSRSRLRGSRGGAATSTRASRRSCSSARSRSASSSPSDVFHSGANVETLLFGSLLLIDRTRSRRRGRGVGRGAVCSTVAPWAPLARDGLRSRDRTRARRPLGGARGGAARSRRRRPSSHRSTRSARCSCRRSSSSRLRRRGSGRSTLRSWQLASVALAAVEGTLGLWLAFEANVPPGAAIAVVGGARLRARSRYPAPCPPLAAAAVLLLAGCGSTGGGDAASSRRRRRSADWARIVAGDELAVHQILRPNTDPHEYEPRPATCARRAARRSCSRAVSASTAGWRKSCPLAGGDPQRRRPRRGAFPTSSPATRTGGTTRGTPRRQSARSATSSRTPTRRRRATLRRNADAYLRSACARSIASIAACFVDDCRRPQRKLVTDHDAFGYFARRYGIRIVGAVDPVADDPGAAVGRRDGAD